LLIARLIHSTTGYLRGCLRSQSFIMELACNSASSRDPTTRLKITAPPFDAPPLDRSKPAATARPLPAAPGQSKN
jgi:hypothetical protein